MNKQAGKLSRVIRQMFASGRKADAINLFDRSMELRNGNNFAFAGTGKYLTDLAKVNPEALNPKDLRRIMEAGRAQVRDGAYLSLPDPVDTPLDLLRERARKFRRTKNRDSSALLSDPKARTEYSNTGGARQQRDWLAGRDPQTTEIPGRLWFGEGYGLLGGKRFNQMLDRYGSKAYNHWDSPSKLTIATQRPLPNQPGIRGGYIGQTGVEQLAAHPRAFKDLNGSFVSQTLYPTPLFREGVSFVTAPTTRAFNYRAATGSTPHQQLRMRQYNKAWENYSADLMGRMTAKEADSNFNQGSTMNKQALLNVDPKTVGRYAMGGLLTGGSVAALLNLIHNARAQMKARQDLRDENKPDENTIVLTLPSKQGECNGTPGEPHKIKVHESSKTVTRFLKDHTGKQARHYDGEYGKKMAAHGWPTLTAASLAALGGGGIGAVIVDKLYQQQREKQLKRELEMAKQEYMSALTGSKTAASIESLFPDFSTEKTASQDSSFGAISYPIAATAILAILGAGGTGYLTKKILDAKLQEAEEQGRDIPKIKRIVFQSSPSSDPSKHASAEDIEVIKAAFALIFDHVGGTRICLDDEQFKKAAAAAGITGEALMLKAASDADDVMAFLHQHPDLVNAASSRFLANKPVQQFMARTTPGRAYAVRRIGKMVEGLSDPQVKLAQTAGAGGFGGSVGGNASPIAKKQKSRRRLRMGMPWQKVSQELPTQLAAKKVLQSITGTPATDPNEIASAVADEQERRVKDKRMSEMREPGTVQIEARGQAAEKYLTANQKKIVNVVKRLAAEGQI